MSASAPIRFPAIEMSDVFNVVEKASDRATTAAWRNGFYKDLAYFDSDGRLWCAQAIPERHPALLDRLLNSRIKATLIFTEQHLDPMQHAKLRLCGMIENDPDDRYDQFVHSDDLKKLVMSAGSAPQLIEVARSRGAGSEFDYKYCVCASCEHDLRGGPFEVCPECGAPTQRPNKAAA
jgi:hypothetical protein